MAKNVIVELDVPSSGTNHITRVVNLERASARVIGVGKHAYLNVIRDKEEYNYNMRFVIRWVVTEL